MRQTEVVRAMKEFEETMKKRCTVLEYSEIMDDFHFIFNKILTQKIEGFRDSMQWKDCNFLLERNWTEGFGKNRHEVEGQPECKIQTAYGTGSHYDCSMENCILIKILTKLEG